MKIVCFGTLKGGTGKTTVAYNVGGILAETYKVLFVDVDPQANLSDNAGIDTTDQDGYTVRDVFANPQKIKAQNVIVEAPMEALPNLDIIASHIELTYTEMQLVATPGREKILSKWFERNREYLERYDYIILDTNPSLGLVNQNAFVAADSIILVSDVSKKAILGAQQFMYRWGNTCESLEIEDQTQALVINNSDIRMSDARDIKEFYQDDEDFGPLVLNTVIPYRKAIKSTETHYKPINILAPESDSCEAFRGVISELKERGIL